jgi:hypothetical protein
MINLRFKFINKSGIMVVSDPCVPSDTVDCLVFERVRKGVWCVDVSFDSSMNIQELKATHEDSRIMLSTPDQLIIKVHSEQIGFFDGEDYRNDKAVEDMPREQYKITKPGDKWYCAMSYITNQSQHGADGYSYGALTEITNDDYKVLARRSLDKDYVEFEIKH